MTQPRRSRLPFRLTEIQYLRAERELEGRCRSCGHASGPIEGDAWGDRCELCGRMELCGIEELLARGEIEIID